MNFSKFQSVTRRKLNNRYLLLSGNCTTMGKTAHHRRLICWMALASLFEQSNALRKHNTCLNNRVFDEFGQIYQRRWRWWKEEEGKWCINLHPWVCSCCIEECSRKIGFEIEWIQRVQRWRNNDIYQSLCRGGFHLRHPELCSDLQEYSRDYFDQNFDKSVDWALNGKYLQSLHSDKTGMDSCRQISVKFQDASCCI